MKPLLAWHQWLKVCVCVFVCAGSGISAYAGVLGGDASVSTVSDTRSIEARWVSAISADNTTVLRALLDESSTAAGLASEENTASVSPGNTVSQPLWQVTASNGKTALMVACKVGDEALAMRLVELGSNIKAKTITDGTAFMFAVLGDQQRLAQWLIGLGANMDAQGSNGWTGVMIASAKGLDKTLQWLLSEGANAQTPDVYGFSPLMRAADNGHADAVRALINQKVSEQGIDVHWQDELNNTALHYAVAGDHHEIVQLLLRANASASTPNSAGLSALDLAMSAVSAADDPAVSETLQQRREEVLETLQRSSESG